MYNDKVFDLLSTADAHTGLDVRVGTDGSASVAGLEAVGIDSAEEARDDCVINM